MERKLVVIILLGCNSICQSISSKIATAELNLFAVSYVLKFEKLVEDTEICQTWIFVSNRDSKEEPLLDLIVQNRIDIQTKSILIHTTATNGSTDATATEFYFDKMYTSQEIMESHSPGGPIKYSRSCSVVFICSPHQSDYRESALLTKSIVLHRLARPHKDYFLYILGASAVESFMSSQFEIEIRYKYFISSSGLENTYNVQDTCSTGGSSKGTLFSTGCNAILNGRNLVVTSVAGTPWLTFLNSHDDSLQSWSGIYFKLISDSAGIFNFTYTLNFANSGGSSGFIRNGLWYGNVGEVYHRTADIGMGGGITSHRDSAIDTGIPFEDISRVFFIKAASPKRSWTAIFSPFKPPVWILILITTGLLVPVCLYALKLEYAKQTHTLPSAHSSLRIIYRVVTSVVGILVEQDGSERTWVGAKIKFTLFLWMFFSLVMGAAYRSRLIYFLTFKAPGEIPGTHSALIENNYKLFFRYYGGVAYKAAMESTDPMQHEILRRSILINSSKECIVAAILHENSACLDWDEHGSYASYTNATFHVRQTKDLIIRAKDSVMDGLWISWIYRNMSPLIETFDSYLVTTFASGIYNKWVSEDWTRGKIIGATWLKSNPNLPANKKLVETFAAFAYTVKPLTFSSLYGVFGVLLLNSVIALITFVIENNLKSSIWKNVPDLPRTKKNGFQFYVILIAQLNYFVRRNNRITISL